MAVGEVRGGPEPEVAKHYRGDKVTALSSTPSERVRPVTYVVLFVAGFLAVLASLLAIDLYLHRHYHDSLLNPLGYRGPFLGSKAQGELRVAVVGESSAYGFGVATDATMPAQLQALLQDQLKTEMSVANLAANGDSSICFTSTLQHFDYLRPDVVIFYAGANDLAEESARRNPETCLRNRSKTFRSTGYYPVLPDFVREQYFKIRYGEVAEGYRQTASIVVSTASLGSQPNADSEGASGSLGPGPRFPAKSSTGTAFVCQASLAPLKQPAIRDYADVMRGLVAQELAKSRMVIVANEPRSTQSQCDQQSGLWEDLAAHFSTNPLFHLVNAGADVDVSDPAMSLDGAVHLTRQGNEKVAARLAAEIRSGVQPAAAGTGSAGSGVSTGTSASRVSLLDQLAGQVLQALGRYVAGENNALQ